MNSQELESLDKYTRENYVMDVRGIKTTGQFPALLHIFNCETGTGEYHPRCQKCGQSTYPCSQCDAVSA